MNENNVPKHIAIIMDGNRRWAKEKGKKTQEGHKAGMKTIKKTGLYAFNQGVKVLSLYAFSTENFNRSPEEVNYLMDLFVMAFEKEIKIFEENDIKIFFSGRKESLRDDVIKAMDKIVDRTKNNKSGILNICLNYGGHAEIVDATKKIVEIGYKAEEINEEIFAKHLYQELPPIDFLIRTSGEIRVSNFMLWQLSYAEMYFTNVYFPDFNEFEFDKALKEYYNRKRRYGGDKNENKNN